MCVAVPGEVLSIDSGGLAEVDFGGTRRTVSLALLEQASVGDFVIVHAGFALHRVTPEHARETLHLLRTALDDDRD
jgi:hydrogenase expression/formation protein HypC